MRLIPWSLGLVALAVVAWLAACWYVSDQFLTLGIVDYDLNDELKTLDELAIADLKRREVNIQGAGASLSASFFEQPNSARCAVILLPGIGGNRTQVLPALPMFWNFGCHVLAYDPRGTGASERLPRTFGYFEKRDNAAVIRWIEKQTGLRTTQIGVWGPSFGAAVGLLTLDEIEPIGFVIADSTFSSFAQVTQDTIAILSHATVASVLTPGVIAWLQFRTGMNAREVVPKDSIGGTTTPVLLIHAKEDPAMHVSHTHDVYEARTSTATRMQITDWGAGHADSAIVDPDAYQALVEDFLSGLDL